MDLTLKITIFDLNEKGHLQSRKEQFPCMCGSKGLVGTGDRADDSEEVEIMGQVYLLPTSGKSCLYIMCVPAQLLFCMTLLKPHGL